MREIKFRAWDKNAKQMLQDVHETCDMVPIGDMPYFARFLELPQDFIVMQFTGLKDKNGVEVYEGDILKTSWEYHDGPRESSIRIEWSEKIAGFECVPLKKNGADFLRERKPISEYEVIGNIYENLELLKRRSDIPL